VILNRNCKIIDSIIVDKNNKNFGYGSILIKYITNYIKHNGFLLCEKKNINFYKKHGWIIDNTINIINKNINNNLYKMVYNFSSKYVNYI
jgi:GNAT superfamily N-acetyltransferase